MPQDYELIGEITDKIKVRAGVNGIRIHLHPIILKHHRGITALGSSETERLIVLLEDALEDVKSKRKALRSA